MSKPLRDVTEQGRNKVYSEYMKNNRKSLVCVLSHGHTPGKTRVSEKKEEFAKKIVDKILLFVYNPYKDDKIGAREGIK